MLLAKERSLHALVSLLFVICGFFTSSAAESSDDKKWLLNALLGLGENTQRANQPYYPMDSYTLELMPLSFPRELDTIVGQYDRPVSIQVESEPKPEMNPQKRGRISPFQLLCCNIPPSKHASSRWAKFKKGSLQWMLQNAAGRRSKRQPREKNWLNGYKDLALYPLFKLGQEKDGKRRVTVVHSGISGINTG